MITITIKIEPTDCGEIHLKVNRESQDADPAEKSLAHRITNGLIRQILGLSSNKRLAEDSEDQSQKE